MGAGGCLFYCEKHVFISRMPGDGHASASWESPTEMYVVTLIIQMGVQKKIQVALIFHSLCVPKKIINNMIIETKNNMK